MAQSPGEIPSDSLSSMDYSALINEFKKEQDSLKRQSYLIAYLRKAKKSQNSSKIVAGYKNLLYYSALNLRTAYADSMILAAEKSRDTVLIASTYLTKGIVLYGLKKYQGALDNYLKADDLVTKVNASAYLRYKIKYNIGIIKHYLGAYEEALVLFKACLEFYKDDYPRPYLNTLHSIALCYSHLEQYSMSNYFNTLGLRAAEELGNRKMNPYFMHCQGINAYHLKSYQKAIDLLCEVLPEIDNNKDFANVILGKFYIGMSLWELKRFDQAISYFEDVDKNFQLKGYIKPEFREAYKLLVDYYDKHNDHEREVFYTKRLISVDSVNHNRYKVLSTTVHRDYNMAKLQDEKTALYNQWTRLMKYGRIWKGIVLLLLCFILWWIAKSLGVYSKVNKRIWKETSVEPKDSSLFQKEDSGTYVPQDTQKEICQQLVEFEKGKYFLQNVSLGGLATRFKTNSKYLSKVIRKTKNKAFSAYINDLKIEELMKMLARDKKLRHYNYKSIANMVGFGSVSRLTRAFKFRTNTTVSDYIKQLEKKEQKEFQ